MNVPAADKSPGVQNSDLHLYVTYSNTPGGYTAAAKWCTMYQNNNLIRPNFGSVNFNIG